MSKYTAISIKEFERMKELFLRGLSFSQIADALVFQGYPRRHRVTITAKMSAAGIKRTNGHEALYRPSLDQKLLAMDGTVNGATETYGKVNPFKLAEIELAAHFTTFNGMRHFRFDDGLKPIRRIADWHEVIRFMNRKRKESGKKQIEYVKEWIV